MDEAKASVPIAQRIYIETAFCDPGPRVALSFASRPGRPRGRLGSACRL